MKFCLAVQFQNEAPFLRLHLPVWLQSAAIDGVVAVDGGSTDDSRAVVCQACIQAGKHFTIYDRAFDWNFSAQSQFMLDCAEHDPAGYALLLRLDPDELMFGTHITMVKAHLEHYRAVNLPRWNFVEDRLHHCPVFYPDYQARAWQLHQGVSYAPSVIHASVGASYLELGWTRDLSTRTDVQRDILDAPGLPIFHYAGLVSPVKSALKAFNYDRIARGLPPVAELPLSAPPFENASVFRVPFIGVQPLDPAVVGARAPFEEGGS